MRGPKHHIKAMQHFDFKEPAEVFVGGGRLTKRFPMVYRRFRRGEDAIRYAVEMQSAEKLAVTVVQVDEARFGADEIRSLYDSEDYPLSRRQAS